jgi:hypothetical protein
MFGMILAAIVTLVAMGQEVGAIVTAGIVVASALGVPIVQGAVNSEKMGQVKDLANGNLAAMRDQMSTLILQHQVERAELHQQLQAANDKAVQLAAMVPSEIRGVL